MVTIVPQMVIKVTQLVTPCIEHAKSTANCQTCVWIYSTVCITSSPGSIGALTC